MIRSLLIIKPEAVARGLIGKILTRFEKKGFHMVASKMTIATPDILSKHYEHLLYEPFYPNIIKSMTKGPIFVFVLEGPLGTVEYIRKMVGKTNPMEADVGTIRGDLSISVGCNVCHASDSIKTAEKEINLWFTSSEILPQIKQLNHDLIYRD